jgi:CHASE3 domain sensor protein
MIAMNREAITFIAFMLSAFVMAIYTYSLTQKMRQLIIEKEHWKEVAGCDVIVEDLVLNAYICVKKERNNNG